MKDILDLHTHTIASCHAYSTLNEMILSAAQKGLAIFGSSDHAPSVPGCCHVSYFSNFKVIPPIVHGVRVLMGCELNILNYNGEVDLEKRQLDKLDFSIASIHVPCYQAGSVSENTNAYLGVIENPGITIIGHPDDGRFPVDYETLAAAAHEHHKLLEVNSSSLHPLCTRVNARENYITMLKYCVDYQTPVIISSDAHFVTDTGNHERAIELLEEISFPEELIVNTSIDKIAEYIPKLKNPDIAGGLR